MEKAKTRAVDTFKRAIIPGLVWLTIGILFALSTAFLYNRIFIPDEYISFAKDFSIYKSEKLVDALSVEKLQHQRDSIWKQGSRFLGYPGFYATGSYVKRCFEDADLEIYEHACQTLAPVTRYRSIAVNASQITGEKEASLEVYPFMPNFLQPVVTGKEGIRGTLRLLNAQTIESGVDFSNCIGVVDSKDGYYDASYAFNWVRYAKLGIKALIISHTESLSKAPWDLICDRFNGIKSSSPVNFVRLAASPEIFNFLGEDVHLRVKSEYKNVLNKTYIGVLRSPRPSREAIVVFTSYDAMSVLPDLAPGGLQTVNLSVFLQLVKGLSPYRENLSRDIIFIAYGGSSMADDGINQLLGVLRENSNVARENRLLDVFGIQKKTEEFDDKRLGQILKEQTGNADSLGVIGELITLFNKNGFLSEAEQTRRTLSNLDRHVEAFFKTELTHVLNSVVFELSDTLQDAKIKFERLGSNDIQSEEFKTYFSIKSIYDKAVSAAGYSVINLLTSKDDYIQKYRIRKRMRDRLSHLQEYHRAREKRLEEERRIATLFNQYKNIAAYNLNLVTQYDSGQSHEVLSYNYHTSLENQFSTNLNLLSNVRSRLNLESAVTIPEFDKKTYRNKCLSNILLAYNLGSMYLNHYGYPAYSFIHFDRVESYRRYAFPVIQDFMKDMGSIQNSAFIAGEVLLTLAHGMLKLEPAAYEEWWDWPQSGRVLVSDVGQAVVPNYRFENAIVAPRPFEQKGMYNFPGRSHHLMILTNPYGSYYLPKCPADFEGQWRTQAKGGYNQIAAGYNKEGLISYMKNEGEDGQRLFKSVNLNIRAGHSVNMTLVTFRSSPVTILDLTNPQTMKDYSSVNMVTPGGLVDFNRRCSFEAIGLNTTFLPPDERFYTTLKSGAPTNEMVQEVRGFMLGIEHPDDIKNGREIDGPGYLVADNAFISDVASQTAGSMAYVNGYRLDLQNKYHMADERTNTYHQKTLSFIEKSNQPDITYKNRIQLSRDAVTYASLNHPVLRESIMEAVLGIIWYLGLLVPFVFFFEKLLFCFSDIRKQLAAQAIIFLVVFLLLRLLHPAFQMVNSSLMILLGFVIILISSSLTILFSSKFQENLEELRKKAGKVSAAEVNTLGVMGSAFMLGLNNMNRRKLRTGLTCATLTLLTFVMICFTTVENKLVDENAAIGKASYEGMLIRRDQFAPVTNAEVFAFRNKYGDRYEVCQRKIFYGILNPTTQQYLNPAFKIEHEKNSVFRVAEAKSILQMPHTDPLQKQLDFLTEQQWFEPGDDMDDGGICPVMLNDEIAGVLGISPQLVNTDTVFVNIHGQQFQVKGIFTAASLQALRDLDGLDLLPMDLEAMATVSSSDMTGHILAEDDDPRIPAEYLVIMPDRNLFQNISSANTIILSLAIVMPDATYREAKETIENFMEQTAQPVYYGLDGISYKGTRSRATTMAGLIDLLIPLIIAGLTVLNTMRGSVYERREEISVYNAVGIAPGYIFLMFLAEAFVYAVVGSVLGYILSQGTGTVLTALNWTGGLNMSFSSLSTIYASLTIAGAVFISTYSPAKSAMEIAAPAEETGWKLPEPQDDDLAFDLPFNFRTRGRVAVLCFFERYLLNHGEGSAGRFFASVPDIDVESSVDELGEQTFIPQIACTIWLKPFDLAVSQRLIISMPLDSETGRYKAHLLLQRLSGTRESWMRLNHGFVSQIRKHFLHWRAVSNEEQEEMYREAKKKFFIKYKLPEQASV